jgi:hypothetical protein
MVRISLHSTRAIVWAVLLAIFVLIEVYARSAWLSLAIPGAILLWYGLVAEPKGKIALRNRPGIDLH